MEISIRRHAPLVGAYTLWALCMLAAATLAGCGGGTVGVDATKQSVVSSGAVAPQITTQPQSATVTAGQTATFSVAATGTAPLSYQWMKNSTAISGAKSAGYTTPATSSSDNGASFTVAVAESQYYRVVLLATSAHAGAISPAVHQTRGNPASTKSHRQP